MVAKMLTIWYLGHPHPRRGICAGKALGVCQDGGRCRVSPMDEGKHSLGGRCQQSCRRPSYRSASVSARWEEGILSGISHAWSLSLMNVSLIIRPTGDPIAFLTPWTPQMPLSYRLQVPPKRCFGELMQYPSCHRHPCPSCSRSADPGHLKAVASHRLLLCPPAPSCLPQPH